MMHFHFMPVACSHVLPLSPATSNTPSLQAIPGYMLLVMPIVYGVSGTPPFVTR